MISLKDQIKIQLEGEANKEGFKDMVLTLFAEDYEDELIKIVEDKIEDYYARETIIAILKENKGKIIKENAAPDYDIIISKIF